MYIETAKDGRRLFEMLRAAKAKKPVVILKGGRTGQGSPPRLRTPGSLAGDDRAWVALSRQTGCVLVDTLDQFIDTLLDFPDADAAAASIRRKRVVLFGNGGGTSVLATDCFARLGLDVTPFGAAGARCARRA